LPDTMGVGTWRPSPGNTAGRILFRNRDQVSKGRAHSSVGLQHQTLAALSDNTKSQASISKGATLAYIPRCRGTATSSKVPDDYDNAGLSAAVQGHPVELAAKEADMSA
jgi:hypothetical protein